MSYAIANVQCLSGILFDISPQANKILHVIHLGKCLLHTLTHTERKIPIYQIQHEFHLLRSETI